MQGLGLLGGIKKSGLPASGPLWARPCLPSGVTSEPSQCPMCALACAAALGSRPTAFSQLRMGVSLTALAPGFPDAQQGVAGGLPWISGLPATSEHEHPSLGWGPPSYMGGLLLRFCHLLPETLARFCKTRPGRSNGVVWAPLSPPPTARPLQCGTLTLRTFLMPLMVEVSRECTLRSSLT